MSVSTPRGKSSPIKCSQHSINKAKSMSRQILRQRNSGHDVIASHDKGRNCCHQASRGAIDALFILHRYWPLPVSLRPFLLPAFLPSFLLLPLILLFLCIRFSFCPLLYCLAFFIFIFYLFICLIVLIVVFCLFVFWFVFLNNFVLSLICF